MLIRILAIGVGGGSGAVLRYMIQEVLPSSIFPLSTLLINIVGSFLLGGVTSYFMNRNRGEILQLALGTGLCGGFTTMSTFSAEAVALMRESILLSGLYIGCTVLGGLTAYFIGQHVFLGRRSEERG
ncbi:CrcB family protein [Peribacillus asahii]|uniref:Fluoride-specific ion channel FluC n=1 Tax=Peribacillus asahii TaxID=228899 RepID=A0A398BEA7_9BACI|nr:CrcB family protein [Peribacillus asahii]RID87611.1 CrcB family protein [Peribacillus asahii]